MQLTNVLKSARSTVKLRNQREQRQIYLHYLEWSMHRREKKRRVVLKIDLSDNKVRGEKRTKAEVMKHVERLLKYPE